MRHGRFSKSAVKSMIEWIVNVRRGDGDIAGYDGVGYEFIVARRWSRTFHCKAQEVNCGEYGRRTFLRSLLH